MTGWANLPPDLLGSVLRRLPFPDNIRCASVCSPWRSAVRFHLHPSIPRPPWLMISSPDRPSSPDAATFFSLPDAKLHTIRLPDPPIADRLWIGSSAGWLVTADSASEIILLNPVTRIQLPLPSVATLPHVAAVLGPQGHTSGYRYSNKILAPNAIRYSLFNKAIVDSDSPPTVMLILYSSPTLAFARAGDEAWTPLEKSCAVHDVVLHKGRFHSIDVRGKVEAWDLDCPSSPRAIPVLPELQSLGAFVDKYLVESLGHLLQVWRMAASIRVFKLDQNRDRWAELTSIGDRVLFLGNNHSMSLSSREFPELRGNRIYFTETSRLFPPMGCGNWVFCLEDGSTAPCYPHDSVSDWLLPIWIVPCFS